MCMHKLYALPENLRKWNTSLRFRALYGIILKVIFSEKVLGVFVYFCQECYDAFMF